MKLEIKTLKEWMLYEPLSKEECATLIDMKLSQVDEQIEWLESLKAEYLAGKLSIIDVFGKIDYRIKVLKGERE
jgi:hypothetical protein